MIIADQTGELNFVNATQEGAGSTTTIMQDGIENKA